MPTPRALEDLLKSAAQGGPTPRPPLGARHWISDVIAKIFRVRKARSAPFVVGGSIGSSSTSASSSSPTSVSWSSSVLIIQITDSTANKIFLDSWMRNSSPSTQILEILHRYLTPVTSERCGSIFSLGNLPAVEIARPSGLLPAQLVERRCTDDSEHTCTRRGWPSLAVRAKQKTLHDVRLCWFAAIPC